MDNIGLKINLITNRLTFLQLEVSNRNSLNLTDINIHAEIFFRDLFNLLGYSFNDSNFDKQNAAFIDLIDTNKKIAMQVTSQNNSGKISDSIKGFFASSKNKGFKLQVLLISKNAKDYQKDFTDGGKYPFNHKEDVIDIKRLLAIIRNIKDFDVLKKIATFLDKHIIPERAKTESTEVETILSLIDFLSKDENRKLTEKGDNVDPKKKIHDRFSQHSNFIIEQYQNLFSIYNVALMEAHKNIDSVNALIISSYLKDESDFLLTKNDNNPKLALHELVEYFYSKLSRNGFIKFNKQAIRFYLLDEMIKCNVFPN